MHMLSVAIIARDEEHYLPGALESVRGLADEILLLLDSRTQDRSAAIGRAAGARVLIEPWRGFPAQRNRALGLCAGDWVLFLDADERVTPELGAEIQNLLIQDDMMTRSQDDKMSQAADTLSPAGYWLPRHNQFFGKRLRGGGWYPDHQLRLLRRDRARYDEARLVHELVLLDGPSAYLSGHLLHLNIERLDELWRKQTSYAIQEAQTLQLAGRRARWRNFVGAPLREFQRRYVALGGWRDGALGLFLCATLAYFEWVKFVHLKGLERL
ncbi:MAG TPA: glycosyltransferase family 2 protein [Roseiflexaceae bacterium]|nr:glycosyltransferase family 2 protein [Roseiflexaceae bacterium]